MHNKNKKAKTTSEEIAHDIVYRHIPPDAGLPHTNRFQWDDYEGDDRGARIPELIASGQYTRSLRGTPTEPPGNPRISTDDGRSQSFEIPEPFDPCGYFSEHIIDKGKGKSGAASTVTRLSLDKFDDSIAAVVRAVNERHPPGLSFITPSSQ
jgi:hypothetical protein